MTNGSKHSKNAATTTSTPSDDVNAIDDATPAKKICGYWECFELAAMEAVDETVDDDDEDEGSSVAGTHTASFIVDYYLIILL